MTAAARKALTHQEQVANAASLAKQDILSALSSLARLKSEMADCLLMDWRMKRLLEEAGNVELRVKSAGRWLLLAEEGGQS